MFNYVGVIGTGIPLRVLLVTSLVTTLGVTRVDDLCSVFGDQFDHACDEDNICVNKGISNVYRCIVYRGSLLVILLMGTEKSAAIDTATEY